jgi:Na+/melibiose symporter-like transporter
VFFITEPRELKQNLVAIAKTKSDASFKSILMDIQPLWGFLLYGIYAIIERLSGAESHTYYVEFICLLITLFFIFQTLLQKEAGKSKEEAGILGFKKILAAHSFTWIGIQTMFVYMFAYVQYKMPDLSALKMGQVVSISFLILNVTGAVLPVAILEPLTRKIGSTKTHAICIGSMAVGYLGMLFIGASPFMVYALMAFIGIGWAATISLPFAIMTQKVGNSKIGLYMGLFNLSVVLPQLVASLGVGHAISIVANKNLIFMICALTLAISSLLWFTIRDSSNPEKIQLKSSSSH